MIVCIRKELIWDLVTVPSFSLPSFPIALSFSLSLSLSFILLLPAYADQKIKEKIEVAELLVRNMLQFQDQPSTDHHLQEQEQEAQGNNIDDPEPIKEKGDNHVDDTVPSQEPGRPSLGELSAVEEENEGFRTPTSMEHKIPAATECPPAPRKPTATRAIPMKRRISKVPRRLQFEEFEVLIPPKILASFLSRLVKPPRDERK